MNRMNFGFDDDTLLPTQHYLANRSRASCEGEMKLMIAIMEDALNCFKANAACQTEKEQKLFNEASVWFSLDDPNYLYSFRNACLFLGLDPDAIRAELKRYRWNVLKAMKAKEKAEKAEKAQIEGATAPPGLVVGPSRPPVRVGPSLGKKSVRLAKQVKAQKP